MAETGGFPPVEEQARALLADCSEEIPRGGLLAKLKRASAEKRPLLVKLGADPSAPHLHLGHTVVLRKLRQFQDFGHTVQFLIGDFTGMIGDPTGRSVTRPALTRAEIEANSRTYEEQVWRILDRSRTRVVFNSEWCQKLKFDDIIKLSAKLTVARILERDDFMKRYKEGRPIGLHEFLYPLVQGYDSVVLKSDVEMCGTDQIFNCHVGRALQEAEGMDPQVILSVPLLEGLDGVDKMSKSKGNAVGITEDPGEMYGKVLSIPDTLTEKYFRLLLGTGVPAGASARDAKHALARAIVVRYHGESQAAAAAERFERMFVRHEAPEDAPEAALSAADLKDGRIWAVKLLTAAKLAASRSEAERLIKQGAVEVDGVVVNDPKLDLSVKDGSLVKVGKRKFAKVKLK